VDLHVYCAADGGARFAQLLARAHQLNQGRLADPRVSEHQDADLVRILHAVRHAALRIVRLSESFHERLDKMGSNPKESKKKDKTKKHKNKKVDLPLSGLARARAGFASFAGLACSRAGPAICRRRHAAHRARGKWRASKS
jgi:hypothetical protein